MRNSRRSPAPPVSREALLRVWIDTDIGSDVDDALALAYALRHPVLEVVGVSTVFGDVALRTRIAEALLSRAGAATRAAAIPVLTGLGVPLSPGRKGRMFGHEGVGLFDDPQPTLETEQEPEGEARIEALARALEHAAPEVLIAIGPMTNLGALVDAGVVLPPLTIMGGKTRDVLLPGMIEAIPEWNWFCDPVAVGRVLAAAAVPPRVVPGEVTFTTALLPADLERLAAGDPLAATLAALSGHWLDALANRLGAKEPRVALHDPLAVATLVTDLCAFRPCTVRIDERGGTEHVSDGARIDVAGAVDNDALREHLLSVWLSD